MRSFHLAFPHAIQGTPTHCSLSLGSAPVPKFFTLADTAGFLTLLSDDEVENLLPGMLIIETMHPGAIREWITGQERPKIKQPPEKKLNLSLSDLGLKF